MSNSVDDDLNLDQVKSGSKLKKPKDSGTYLDSHQLYV